MAWLVLVGDDMDNRGGAAAEGGESHSCPRPRGKTPRTVTVVKRCIGSAGSGIAVASWRQCPCFCGKES